MVKTFPSMKPAGMDDHFVVTDVELQAETAAVKLSYGGQEIPRPFYFVHEDGRYALNVARPGFSQALPEGTRAMNTYRVSTGGTATWGGQIGCFQSNHSWFWIDVSQPNKSYPIGCENVCGFWTGGWFGFGALGGFANWEGSPYCDYNTFGTDVWVNGLNANCNDPC
jgi:hypothetical protein